MPTVVKRGNGMKIVRHEPGELHGWVDSWGKYNPSDEDMNNILKLGRGRYKTFYELPPVTLDYVHYAIQFDDEPDRNEFGEVTP